MRKALIGMILAATVLTPGAAMAQRHGGDHREAQGESGGDRAAYRAQRQEQRAARQAQQPQQQVQQQQVQVVQRNRGDGGNRGNWRGNGGGGDNVNRGNWNRGGDNNARANWNRGGNDGNRGNWNRGDRNNQGSVYPQAWQGNPNDPALRHYQRLERQNQNQGNRDGGRRDWRNDGRNDGRNWRNDGRNDRRGDWNRGWRNDNRYNWQRYRYSNRNFYHLNPYYAPYRNYRYSRFSIGLVLDSLFYDQRYWIGDPYQYRLPPAPYGTQWVRYYDDVLLVDIYTGEVVDAIYDFFW